MSHSIAIIGSGPAGLTAAIYTSRAFIDTTIYTGMEPGGQLTLTTEVENFPGFPEGVMGPDLMEKMQIQAKKFGSKLELKAVSKIELQETGKKFRIHDNYGATADYDAVIVSSGASARYLGLPEESQYHGKGYHSCATCDGFFYKGKEIVVVGGGDSAMEEANFLTKFATKVTIIHRSEHFRASPIMLKRAQDNPKIQFLMNKQVTKLQGEGKITSIELTDSTTREVSEFATDAVFVAIGHTPNTGFAKGFLTMDEVGYLIPVARTMSNVEGIFVAGDVSDRDYRQAITAAGEGCKAAIDAEKWLDNQIS
jgi:thioredoxin reductase (NADPH)